jgi:hypothetical protein
MQRVTIFTVVLILIVSTFLIAQSVGDYRTRDSGDWSNAQIWERYNGSSWVPIGSPPTGAETITVLSPDSVFVNVLVSITDSLINQGIVNPIDSLTITIANGGTYKHDRNEGSVPKCIWDAGSTMLLTGVTDVAPDDRGQDYYNLIFNTPDKLSNLHMDLSGNTISGDIRVINTGQFGSRWRLTTADLGDTAIVNIMGDIIVEGADAYFETHGTSNAMTTFFVHHYGNVNVTAGNFSVSRGSQGGGTTTWYLHEGDFHMSDAETKNSTATPGGARFVFTKDGGVQNLTLSNVTYGANAIPIQVDSTTTLNVGSSAIEGSGLFTLNAGATLATAHAGGIAGAVQSTGTVTLDAGASYIFNGTVAQVTSALMPDTVNNLTIDNAAGVALSQETVINGVLRLVAGVFDNTIPFTLGPNGSISFEGGSLLIPLGIESDELNVPKSFFMEQNYPNPFNPSTTIRFGLPSVSYVTAKLYNVLGQEVATMFEGRLNAGEHELQFDAAELTSGIYFYRIQAGDNVDMKRMVLLR